MPLQIALNDSTVICTGCSQLWGFGVYSFWCVGKFIFLWRWLSCIRACFLRMYMIQKHKHFVFLMNNESVAFKFSPISCFFITCLVICCYLSIVSSSEERCAFMESITFSSWQWEFLSGDDFGHWILFSKHLLNPYYVLEMAMWQCLGLVTSLKAFPNSRPSYS